MSTLLYVAAILIVAIAMAHSYLGERYILIRLLRRDDLPRIFGSADFTARTLRFAWHLTSVAWLGFAAVLVWMAQPRASLSTLGLVIGSTFLLHFAIALIGSRARHFSWPVFLAISVLVIYATNL